MPGFQRFVPRRRGSAYPLFHHRVAQNSYFFYLYLYDVPVADSAHTARGARSDNISRHEGEVFGYEFYQLIDSENHLCRTGVLNGLAV